MGNFILETIVWVVIFCLVLAIGKWALDEPIQAKEVSKKIGENFLSVFSNLFKFIVNMFRGAVSGAKIPVNDTGNMTT